MSVGLWKRGRALQRENISKIHIYGPWHTKKGIFWTSYFDWTIQGLVFSVSLARKRWSKIKILLLFRARLPPWSFLYSPLSKMCHMNNELIVRLLFLGHFPYVSPFSYTGSPLSMAYVNRMVRWRLTALDCSPLMESLWWVPACFCWSLLNVLHFPWIKCNNHSQLSCQLIVHRFLF